MLILFLSRCKAKNYGQCSRLACTHPEARGCKPETLRSRRAALAACAASRCNLARSPCVEPSKATRQKIGGARAHT